MLRHLKNKVSQSDYLKSVSILMTGTGIAQLIPIVTSPILSRIYTSYDFGIYAIFYSTSAILVTISTFRYETAIFLPDNNKKAINLLALCFLICLGLSLLTLIALFAASPYLLKLVNLETVGRWALLLPLFLFLSGMYNSFNLWFLRNKEYKFLSKNKIILAVSTACIQIGVGVLRLSWLGLIIANVLGQLLALALMIARFHRVSLKLLKFVSLSEIKKNIVEHKKFPIFTMPSDFVNNISGQLPVFFINSFFGQSILGFYSIGVKFVSLPLSFLSGSIQDVFRQQASRDYVNVGTAKPVYVRTLKILGVLAFFGILLIISLAPTVFSLFLGAKWRVSGEIVRITGFLIMIRFVASPLSYMILIAGKHQYDLLWQLFLVGLTAASFFWGHLQNFSVNKTLFIYTACLSVWYIVNILISYRFSTNGKT